MQFEGYLTYCEHDGNYILTKYKCKDGIKERYSNIPVIFSMDKLMRFSSQRLKIIIEVEGGVNIDQEN